MVNPSLHEYLTDLTDDDKDGVPDQLQELLAKSRQLKLWAEQNGQQPISATALDVGNWACMYVKQVVDVYRQQAEKAREQLAAENAAAAVERAAAAEVEPVSSGGDIEPGEPAVSTTADTEPPLVVDETAASVKTRRGKRS